jgi:hypothetical protein
MTDEDQIRELIQRWAAANCPSQSRRFYAVCLLSKLPC